MFDFINANWEDVKFVLIDANFKSYKTNFDFDLSRKKYFFVDYEKPMTIDFVIDSDRIQYLLPSHFIMNPGESLQLMHYSEFRGATGFCYTNFSISNHLISN